jgi:ATP-dependent Lon protease
MAQEEKVQVLPLVPLKNSVLFPGLLMPLSIGRPASLAAVEAALATEEKEVVVVAQRESDADVTSIEDIYTIGTKAIIRKMSRPTEDHLEVLVMGVERVVVLKLDNTEPFIRGRVSSWPLPEETGPEVEALTRALLELGAKAISLAQQQPQVQNPIELGKLLGFNDDPMRLVFMLASMFSLDLPKEQAIIESQSRIEALRLMHGYLSHELQVLELRNKIATDARTEMSKDQRDYMLRQQMRAIQQELGEKNSDQADIDMLREQIEKAELPEDILKEAKRELGRLERLPAGQPEHQVIRTYLELLLELPWNKRTDDIIDIPRARQVLDEDHFGLKEVKERILEHLGVLKLNPDAKAPILCFVGPPGVGKTSLGQSIARALGRKFERMSLGGMHDESELRGHRRTYIGAMPGRLIQAVRRAGANNPVLMLDEVDKLGRDFRGDPAAALLEILDPEQNRTFRDNYLDLPFDLSKVFFVTTANTLDTIPRPLLDRMEILRLSGYSEEEKVFIARRYLIPRQLKQTGVNEAQCTFSDEALKKLISGYTREAGLRRLEQAIGRVARKIALRVAEGSTEPFTVTPEAIIEMLGPETFHQEEMRKDLQAGVATGLAWTEAGGDVLYIEATLLPDGKGMTLTGQLGEVMQESAKAAQSYVWSHAREIGIDPAAIKTNGVHLHMPAGAVPKDGPSAGVAMVTALASIYSGVPARRDTAMTGEISLAGLVLPVGGVKEKVLAAHRAGMKRVVLPRANERDLKKLPDEVRADLTFLLADCIADALQQTLAEPGLRPATQVAS